MKKEYNVNDYDRVIIRKHNELLEAYNIALRRMQDKADEIDELRNNNDKENDLKTYTLNCYKIDELRCELENYSNSFITISNKLSVVRDIIESLNIRLKYAIDDKGYYIISEEV